MSLSHGNIILARADFMQKYNAKREMLCKDKNLQTYYDMVLESQDLSLESQYNKMFSVDGSIAKLTINGGMSEQGPDWIDVYLGYGGASYFNIRKAIDKAIELKVDTVDVLMNTGGGNIDYLEETADKISEAVNAGITVNFYNAGMIASAGVWLAASGSKIYSVGKTSSIGSIGVVVEGYDYTEYYKRMGIESIVITNTDSPDKRLDLTKDKDVAIFKEELDDIAGIFFEHVASKRNISIESLKELKGRMIISTTAERIGLIDSKVATDPTKGSSNKPNPNKQNTEKKMTEEELKALSASIGSAVAEAVKPLNEKLSALETSIAADKEATESAKKVSASFVSLSSKYPEQSAMIGEEIAKGKECSSDFTLSVVEAETARKAEADELEKNEEKNTEHVETQGDAGKKTGLLDGVVKALGGKV